MQNSNLLKISLQTSFYINFMSIITLTTDYGLKDHFVGSVKGKILTEFSEAQIVDISHNIDPFNTSEASYIITAAYNNFPKGTIHLIGVDIEKSKENRHLAMLFEDHYFICADNGILSLLLQNNKPQKVVEINIHEHLINNPTDIDAFVKVACHLAKAGRLNDVGTEISDIKEITELQSIVSDDQNTIKGYVIYIDNFGNVVTNISRKMFAEIGKNRPFKVILSEKSKQRIKGNITQIFDKYSDVANSGNYEIKNYEGTKLAIFNERGFLEIAIFRSNPSAFGSAKSLLGLGYRDLILIEFAN